MREDTHTQRQRACVSHGACVQESTMDAIELLTTRASNGKLTEPAPDAEALRSAFQAAARAPDHAGLRPWRVKIIRGEARERLGELMAESLLRSRPQTTAAELLQAKSKALRAPLILV